jgi:hypothetical protein
VNVAAADWTAIGSIAGGFGAIAAFLAILATIAVYIFQSQRDKAAAIRQSLQFLHGQQTQVVPSIESGLPAMIDRQIREFRERLGAGTTPGYFLETLFGNDQPTGGNFLFRASAQDSNLSSTAYDRMSETWDELNIKAFEFRGELRIFSYVCETLTWECRRLCSPEFTLSILGVMEQRGDRNKLGKVRDLDELINTLLADHIELAEGEFASLYKDQIGLGCVFIGMLADMTLRMPDKDLLRFSGSNVRQPWLDDFKTNPGQAMSVMLDHLAPKLPEQDARALRDVLRRWNPQPAGAPVTGAAAAA